MPKKILIPLIIFIVLLAGGFGIYIASNQAVRPSDTTAVRTVPHTLAIHEINRTFTVPDQLGTMTYTTNGPGTILLFSPAYEKLGCQSRQIAELQLSNTQKDNDIAISGQYTFAHLVLQPKGQCGGNDGSALADAVSYMVATAK